MSNMITQIKRKEFLWRKLPLIIYVYVEFNY
jgi:hypothetical protein